MVLLVHLTFMTYNVVDKIDDDDGHSGRWSNDGRLRCILNHSHLIMTNISPNPSSMPSFSDWKDHHVSYTPKSLAMTPSSQVHIL
ncbi:hypothetical protein V6N12_025334 [Hibiscus sabdariffa]|uniref:Uncharacterized protein n=1 Tax=Hibiscus sabdariffa TaxID=183260 RepID=A0ABR2CI68_9ROSI